MPILINFLTILSWVWLALWVISLMAHGFQDTRGWVHVAGVAAASWIIARWL